MKMMYRHKTILLALLISVSTYLLFYGQFLSPTHYFWGSDAQIEYVPARVYLYDKIVNEHAFPFWTEKLFSGFPIYADLENAYLHPVNVASILVFGPQLSYKVLHVLEYLIGSLSLFYLLRRKDIGLLGFAAANVIYYFNVFSIDHQIHFNIIMAFYLIPTTLLLADLFVEKRKWRFVFLQSLVVANAVLWGHMQSAVIVFMGIFAYMSVFSFRTMKMKAFLFYFFLLTALVTVESLPQIVPTFDLFGQSSREMDLDYLKGSFTPRMASFAFIPYLLGERAHFPGKDIDKGFTYTEIYIYLGISSIFLSGLALLLLKKSRDLVLAYVFIWTFLIFSFMAYNNIFPSNTPLISLFRDWGRTTALLSFGVALLVAMFIEKIKEVSFRNIRTGWLFIAAPIVYLWVLEILNSHSGLVKRMSRYINRETIMAFPYLAVLEAIVVSLIVVLLAFFVLRKVAPSIFPKMLLPIKILLIGVIFFDLLYFSKDVTTFRLQDISQYTIGTSPAELANVRAVSKTSSRSEGMESLYYDVWGPFGYSQFKEDNYENYFSKLGLGDIKISYDKIPADNFQKLQDAGIVAIAKTDGINFLTTKKLDLLKNDIDGEYLEKKEGKITMRIDNPSDVVVQTYLKYNKNWRVTVDGQLVSITQNGIFFDFPLAQGNHIVKISYFPQSLIIGVLCSLLLAAAVAWILFFWRKTFQEWMV